MKARIADRILAAAILTLTAVLLLAPFAAGATGVPPKPTPPGAVTQAQTQTSTSSASTGPIDLSMTNNPVASSGTSTGNTYVFPAPASAAPLPSGVCPKGDSEAWSVIWGFVSYSRSSTRTEMECLERLIAYAKETAPKPAAAPVVNYITNPPAAEPVRCVIAAEPPPAPAKKKASAAKAKPPTTASARSCK